MNARFYLLTGTAVSCLSVIFGAFGAHALKSIISREMMTVYDTAVQYQMFHALALLLLGVLMHGFVENQIQAKRFKFAGNLFFIGLLLFCGSLYGLAITGIKALGILTPFGGICFILGWLFLMSGLWNHSSRNSI